MLIFFDGVPEAFVGIFQQMQFVFQHDQLFLLLINFIQKLFFPLIKHSAIVENGALSLGSEQFLIHCNQSGFILRFKIICFFGVE